MRITNIAGQDKEVFVAAFVSTQGGVGNTFICSTLADLLITHDPNKVLIVDMDLDTGSMGFVSRARIAPDTHTLHEYLDDKVAPDDMNPILAAKSTAAKSTGEFRVIPAARENEMDAFRVKAEKGDPSILGPKLELLVRRLAAKYDFSHVLMDGAAAIDPVNACASHLSDVTFVICRPGETGHRGIPKMAPRIRELSFPDYNEKKLKAIFNQAMLSGPCPERFEGMDVLGRIYFIGEVMAKAQQELENYESLNNLSVRALVLNLCGSQIPEDLCPNNPLTMEWERIRRNVRTLEKHPKRILLNWLSRAMHLGIALILLAVALLASGEGSSSRITFRSLDTNLDSAISPAEGEAIEKTLRSRFEEFDTDRDKLVTEAEFASKMRGINSARNRTQNFHYLLLVLGIAATILGGLVFKNCFYFRRTCRKLEDEGSGIAWLLDTFHKKRDTNYLKALDQLLQLAK